MPWISFSTAGKLRLVVLLPGIVVKISRVVEYYRGERYWFSGVRSNIREYRLYKEFGDRAPLAPTHFTLLGIINIQQRGKPITQEELELSELFVGLDPEYLRKYDALRAVNFCRINGRIVWCDYGRRILREFLLTFAQ